MSADKLADVIEGQNAVGQILPDRAADRIREAFIVIDRGDLPEIEPERPGYSGYVYINGGTYSLKPFAEQYDNAIRELVALREYRREHPWVDEEAVDDLQGALIAAPLGLTSRQLAHSLIAAGWTKTEATR